MNPHVGICIPSNGTWASGFGRSLALLISRATANGIWEAGPQRVSLLTSEGSVISQLRHNMVKQAINAECSHILFLDSDMVFPPNTLHRLASHKKPIVAANCTTRAEPVAPVAMGMDNKRVTSKGKTGLERVRQIGTAVMLIETELFKKMQPPFFLNEWSDKLRAYSGEDIYFCYKVKAELGINVFIDHDLSLHIKHIGSRQYGHDDIDEEHEVVTRLHTPIDVYTNEVVEVEKKVENG